MLTQNSEKGLGGLDRHGEQRAGVLALIWQADVTNSDGELLPWGSHQLNSVVPQGCRLKEDKRITKSTEKKTENSHCWTNSRWILWWQLTFKIPFVIKITFTRTIHCAFSYFKQSNAANTYCGQWFETFSFYLHSRLIVGFTVNMDTERLQQDALKRNSRKKNLKVFDYNIYLGNHLHSRYWFTLTWTLLVAGSACDISHAEILPWSYTEPLNPQVTVKKQQQIQNTQGKKYFSSFKWHLLLFSGIILG